MFQVQIGLSITHPSTSAIQYPNTTDHQQAGQSVILREGEGVVWSYREFLKEFANQTENEVHRAVVVRCVLVTGFLGFTLCQVNL